MELTSASFFLFVALMLVLFLAVDKPAWRQAVLLVANVAFVGSMLASAAECWALVSLIGLGYLALCLVERLKQKVTLPLAVGAVVATFIVLKKHLHFAALEPLYTTYSVVGMSYVLFRVLHLVIDAGQGSLGRPSLIGYVTYVTFFPAFLSGPIHRYEEFRDALLRNRFALTRASITAAYGRLLDGLVKVIIVAPILQQLFLAASRHVLPVPTPLELDLPFGQGSLALNLPMTLGLAASLYAFYLYFNFAGYTDVVIGVARLFGIALPENFDRPFTARNVAEFWARWHISLSTWFRTYLFSPLVRYLYKRFPERAMATPITVLCLLLAFFIIGLWHGTTLAYVYFGGYLGVAAGAHKIYQLAATRLLGDTRYRTISQNALYGHLSRALTFTYFAAALICFWADAPAIGRLSTQLGGAGSFATVLATSVIATIVLVALDCTEWLLQALFRLVPDRASAKWLWARLGTQVFLVAATVTVFNSTPSFIYQSF